MYQSTPRRGFLSVLDSENPFQTEYIASIAMTVRQLRSALGDVLHSVYLSGDVARRCAKSNATLNITLVTTRKLNVRDYVILNTIRFKIELGNDAVKRVAIDAVSINEVRHLANIFRWGFFLKHCTQCLYGDNISKGFGHFEVSWEVSKAMNDGLALQLKEYRNKIAVATKWGAQLDASEDAAIRLIKASFGLVAHKEQRWEEEVESCSSVFLTHYPDKTLEIERLYYLIERKPVKKRAVIALLDSFGSWVLDEYINIDRKIG